MTKKLAQADDPRLVDPRDVVPPPEREEEAVPNLEDLITDRKIRLEAIRLLTAEREWAEQESEAKKQRKPLTTKLKNILGKNNVSLAVWDDWRINYYATEGRATINREKLTAVLLGAGLPTQQVQSIISASTDISSPSYTLRITKSKGAEEGDE